MLTFRVGDLNDGKLSRNNMRDAFTNGRTLNQILEFHLFGGMAQ